MTRCCTYCRRALNALRDHADQATRDHLLPRRRGRLPNGVRNTVPACRRCNELRARVGHCRCTLACLLDVHPTAKRRALNALADLWMMRLGRWQPAPRRAA